MSSIMASGMISISTFMPSTVSKPTMTLAPSGVDREPRTFLRVLSILELPCSLSAQLRMSPSFSERAAA